jgi:hypothetical protein
MRAMVLLICKYYNTTTDLNHTVRQASLDTVIPGVGLYISITCDGLPFLVIPVLALREAGPRLRVTDIFLL